ncbi:MAG: type I-E CRISPR-associated protein Cse1/CasA [Betaproteobacteria bacterium]
MTPRFNLIDSPWIPVRTMEGEVQEVGLLEALVQAHRLKALAEASPVNLVALYRMLTALLADIRGEFDMPLALDEAWGQGFPAAWVRRYFDAHRDRFWLFHPTHPFMQVPDLRSAEETAPEHRRKPWTQLAPERANGNTPALFDHSIDASPAPISAAQAARCLLGLLQCTPGGLVKVFRTSDRAGPVADSAVVVPLGESLARTLLLCAPLGNDPRFPKDGVAWRRDPPGISTLKSDQDFACLGPRDRYTRLTRAVLLEPASDGASPPVQWIRYGAGVAMAEDPADRDPMVAYRMGAKHLIRVGFEEGRAIWRDLGALLPDPTGKQARPPDILDAALTVLDDAHQQADGHVPVLVAGLASDQAKVERWRVAEFRLPVPLMRDPELARVFRDALAAAEAVARRLRDLAGHLALELLPGTDSRRKRDDAYALCGQWPTLRLFFVAMERGLPQLLNDLAEGDIDSALARWCACQAAAVQTAWDATLRAVGLSGRALRAAAKVERDLRRLLGELAPPAADQKIVSEEVHA